LSDNIFSIYSTLILHSSPFKMNHNIWCYRQYLQRYPRFTKSH